MLDFVTHEMISFNLKIKFKRVDLTASVAATLPHSFATLPHSFATLPQCGKF